MMSDNAFVFTAYAITAVAILGLVAWIMLDQRARRSELAELEAMGVRRRSDARSRKSETDG